MKKLLGLGLFMVISAGHASDVINEQMTGAFNTDDEVVKAVAVLKRQLVLALPGCTLADVPALDGHLFAANAVRVGSVLHHTKTYLVSKSEGCGVVSNGSARSIRRSVTAKILVNVIHFPDGSTEEDPVKVTLVDITVDPSETLTP